jgi:hypothetical protein
MRRHAPFIASSYFLTLSSRRPSRDKTISPSPVCQTCPTSGTVHILLCRVAIIALGVCSEHHFLSTWTHCIMHAFPVGDLCCCGLTSPSAYTNIIETNTCTGSLGEHSPVNVLVPSIVAGSITGTSSCQGGSPEGPALFVHIFPASQLNASDSNSPDSHSPS